MKKPLETITSVVLGKDWGTAWTTFFSHRIKESSGGCVEFTGYRKPNGYGYVAYAGQMRQAYRVSWIKAYGKIPKGFGHHGTCVCHRCDNPACINPEHLFLGTMSDNVADREAKGRTARMPGELSVHAKLKEAQVIRIRLLAKTGLTHKKIAGFYGLCRSTVSYVVSGRLWPHVTEGL